MKQPARPRHLVPLAVAIAVIVAACQTPVVRVAAGKGNNAAPAASMAGRTDHPPAIATLKANNGDGPIRPGTVLHITADASDEDGDPLAFEWKAFGGTIQANQGNTIDWAAPAEKGDYSIQVKVADGRGGTATGFLNITIHDDGVSVSPAIISQPAVASPPPEASPSPTPTPALSSAPEASPTAPAGVNTPALGAAPSAAVGEPTPTSTATTVPPTPMPGPTSTPIPASAYYKITNTSAGSILVQTAGSNFPLPAGAFIILDAIPSNLSDIRSAVTIEPASAPTAVATPTPPPVPTPTPVPVTTPTPAPTPIPTPVPTPTRTPTPAPTATPTSAPTPTPTPRGTPTPTPTPTPVATPIPTPRPTPGGTQFFTYPISGSGGIAFDSAGNAWVANSNSGTVLELSSSGRYVGSYRVGSSISSSPSSVAIDGAGNVWVVNGGDGTVSKLSSTGAGLGTFSNGLDLGSPSHVAIDGAGNAWVTASNVMTSKGTLTKFSSTGTVLATITITGSYDVKDQAGNISRSPYIPAGIAIDRSGNLWVCERTADCVTEFSPTGTVMGTYTVGPSPYELAIDASGNIWVAVMGSNNINNYFASNITKLSSTGTVLGTSAVANSGMIAIDKAAGTVWTTAGAKVYKLSTTGSTLATYTILNARGLGWISVDGSGNVWTDDGWSNTVVKIAP